MLFKFQKNEGIVGGYCTVTWLTIELFPFIECLCLKHNYGLGQIQTDFCEFSTEHSGEQFSFIIAILLMVTV